MKLLGLHKWKGHFFWQTHVWSTCQHFVIRIFLVCKLWSKTDSKLVHHLDSQTVCFWVVLIFQVIQSNQHDALDHWIRQNNKAKKELFESILVSMYCNICLSTTSFPVGFWTNDKQEPQVNQTEKEFKFVATPSCSWGIKLNSESTKFKPPQLCFLNLNETQFYWQPFLCAWNPHLFASWWSHVSPFVLPELMKLKGHHLLQGQFLIF